jgi:hypothetical protein
MEWQLTWLTAIWISHTVLKITNITMPIPNPAAKPSW